MGRGNRRVVTNRLTLILLAVALVMAVAMVSIFDPMDTWWMPQCAFHRLTGLECPGCGTLRGLYAVVHGDVAKGISYNYFSVFTAVLLVLLFYAGFGKSACAQRLGRWLESPAFIVAIIVLIVAWTVVRNLLLE